MPHLVGGGAALVVGRVARVAAEGLIEDANAIPGLAHDAATAGQVRVAQVAPGRVHVDVEVARGVPADGAVVRPLVVVPGVARIAVDARGGRAAGIGGGEEELDPCAGPRRAGRSGERVEVLVEDVDLALDARVAHVPHAVGAVQDVDHYRDPVGRSPARVVGGGGIGAAGVAVTRGHQVPAARADGAVVSATAHPVLDEEAGAVEAGPVVEDLGPVLVDGDDVACLVLVDLPAVGEARPEGPLGEGRGRGEEEEREGPSGVHAGGCLGSCGDGDLPAPLGRGRGGAPGRKPLGRGPQRPGFPGRENCPKRLRDRPVDRPVNGKAGQ